MSAPALVLIAPHAWIYDHGTYRIDCPDCDERGSAIYGIDALLGEMDLICSCGFRKRVALVGYMPGVAEAST